MMQASPEEIRDKADEILARPEYAIEGPGLIQRLFDRVNGWLSEALGSFLGSGGVPALGWIVVVAGVALIGWFLVRVMPRRILPTRTKPNLVEHEQRSRVTRKQWLERAASAEQRGAWPDAVHARYRAMIAGLLEDKLVSTDEGATSGEYVSSFAGLPDRSEPLREATDRFEEVWYGGEPAGAGDSQQLRSLDETILQGQTVPRGQTVDQGHDGSGR